MSVAPYRHPLVVSLPAFPCQMSWSTTSKASLVGSPYWTIALSVSWLFAVITMLCTFTGLLFCRECSHLLCELLHLSLQFIKFFCQSGHYYCSFFFLVNHHQKLSSFNDNIEIICDTNSTQLSTNRSR